MPWYRTSPREFPRERWLALLEQVPDPSPYLLPEWALLWETIWPHSTAELWLYSDAADDPIAGVPLVRRRRGGLEMCFAQPGGAPHGPLGDGDALDHEAYAELAAAVIGPRTVELAASPDWMMTPPDGWTGHSREATSWLADLSRPPGSDLYSGFASSHRRNIARGRDRSPRVATVTQAADVHALNTAWQGTTRASRFVLDTRRGSVLLKAFASTDALIWRTAWCDARPAASAIFLRHRNRAVYVDGAVDRDPVYSGVGHYLFAEVLSLLNEQGVTRIDLGSGPGGNTDPGLEQFKRGWGATPHVRTESVYRRRWYGTLRRILGRD
ncbi:MAG TPA: GNAT family N-acetyltransferase [Acidobacteriota bacterium]|nr:GNAT family N-acetyltransferase [Acidobacteriota bacterium]